MKAFTDAAALRFRAAGRWFDASKQKMRVEIAARDGAHGATPHFEIYDGTAQGGSAVPVVRSDEFLANGGCRRDFPFSLRSRQLTGNLLSFFTGRARVHLHVAARIVGTRR